MALLGCLEQLNIEEPLKRLLRRATSIEHPYERQQNAAVLLAELDRLAPPQVMEKNGRILIGLTTKVKRIFEYDLALKSDAEIQKFVENDLQFSSCVHDPMEPRANPDGTAALGRTIRLLGGRYGYIAVMAHPVGEKLLLVSALEQSSSDAERSRDEAKPSQYEFCFGGVLPNSSNENIVRLQDELLQFGADQKANWIQQRQQAIYKTWLDLLSAKTELERKRKRRFNYVDYETSGGVTHFVLATGADVQFLSDQNIQIEGGKNEIFSGEVVSVNENIVTIKPGQRNQVDVNELPKDGTLVIDTSKADVALDRQRLAVDAVRFGRAVNPTLGDYIVDPSVVPVPAIGEINFIQSSMDDDKRDAVLTALSEPALMLVQGPPGAGKTTFITEVVLQTLRRNPNARILLTSQTHVALDNSLERILKESDEEIRAIRIGNETDDRIAEKAKALLIDRKLPEMRKLALSQGREFIESWAHKSGVNLSNTRMAMALERHAGLRERLERVERQITDIDLTLAKENTSIEVAVRADSEELRSELIREQDALDRDVKESLGELRKHEADKESIEHFADCGPEELRSWANSYVSDSTQAVQLRKMLSVHAEWEIRFGRSPQFKAALVTQSQVIAGTCLGVMGVPGRNEITYDLCIVDEASIATPTEVLVPMARARRTILVGDHKQLSPFQDPELKTSGLLQRFSLTVNDQKATLFNHLRESLPNDLKKSLSTQHRMLPAIGNLVSACFYESALKSAERLPLNLLQRTLPRPVVWFSTSRCESRGSKPVGTSQWNGFEVKYISDLLGRIDFELRHQKIKSRKLSVAVLTGYGEQLSRLHSAIQNRRHEWESYSDIYVNVVDAFQGRDADILIFSVTRSDVRGLGFLREMERINVALSRGKEHLIIVGDHQFCQEAEERLNPLKQVIDYICGNPQDCLLEEIKS
jgi:hypothetical protein